MMVRTTADLLDGHVARKYNKVSAFGAFLDTLADAINAANFVVYFAIRLFGFSFASCSILFTVIVGLILAITFKTGVLFDHSLLKRESSNVIEFLFAIGKYNMVIQISIIYTIIWYFLI